MRIILSADPDGLFEYGGEIIISIEADANDVGGHFDPHATKDLEPRITIFTKHFEDDSDSDLVLSSAHEFRHLWQYYIITKIQYFLTRKNRKKMQITTRERCSSYG